MHKKTSDIEEIKTTCNYCGSLQWTVKKYGFEVHKQMCPNRTNPYHQGNLPVVKDEIRTDTNT